MSSTRVVVSYGKFEDSSGLRISASSRNCRARNSRVNFVLGENFTTKNTVARVELENVASVKMTNQVLTALVLEPRLGVSKNTILVQPGQTEKVKNSFLY